jgi:hypothetical protein
VSAAVCSAVPTDVERAAFQVEIMFFLMVKMSEKTCKTVGKYGKIGKSMNIIYFAEPFSRNVGLPKAMANMVNKLGPGEPSPVPKKNMCRLQALKFQSFCVPKNRTGWANILGQTTDSSPSRVCSIQSYQA